MPSNECIIVRDAIVWMSRVIFGFVSSFSTSPGNFDATPAQFPDRIEVLCVLCELVDNLCAELYIPGKSILIHYRY